MVKLFIFRSINFFNSIIMKVTYELYDKEGEPLMRLEGNEYIAPIGSEVIFYDDQEDVKGHFLVSVEFVSIVMSHSYYIDEDTLYINCEPIEDLSEHDESQLRKYNKIKNKRK
jgi:hypothetical protein